eukprot:TRINITY_DN2044_c0_g1_i1.p1 TRINITY_DN2044_c0_g1~~TRINITY_DN2044_c0_g1_i1.p1  ORF type:complete len:134 (-),score=36.77 TRINITY_DN2044_c0_g1_i1:89-433(-)
MSDELQTITTKTEFPSEESLILEMQEILASSGYEEELRDILRAKLVNEGWRDQLKKHCQEVIRTKGVESINSDELCDEISIFARETFPQDLRIDLNKRVQQFLSEKMENKESKI